MPDRDLLELFVAPLNREGFRYLVSGSVAAMLYGEPRITHDVDLLLFLPSDRIDDFVRLFPENDYYVPPATVLVTESHRERGQFNIIHSASGLKADVYTVRSDTLHLWAFRNQRSYKLDGSEVHIAPPEYVIIRKLEYFREGGSEKHLRDIRSILQMSADLIDRSTLNDWIQTQHLAKEWQIVKSG